MTARALMVLGTASHVGKSLITAGLGRIFADQGLRVAPFKAQNMSLNSAATPDGREIGRAQALQAEACRVVPTADMNPVLIKPTSDTGSQIVVLGRVWGQVTAFDYHIRRVEQLFPVVVESYGALAVDHDLIILEGAGSPAEINLRKHDIVNMRMAHAADATCILVGDIDRGGVFASLLGTLELLEPEDRARIRGFLINKFRGDIALLTPGITMIEQRIGIPCVGVVPYFPHLGLEEEDGVAREDQRTPARVWRGTAMTSSLHRPLRIGVIALPHMANFTDFDALAMEPSVALAFLDHPRDVADADVVVLPGTKQTLDDFAWLTAQGFAEAVHDHSGVIIGICGGLQMLGASMADPDGVEHDGQSRSHPGLGLLPIHTTLRKDKVVRRVTAHSRCWSTAPFTGYEIHMGETAYAPHAVPFATVTRAGEGTSVADGATAAGGRIAGTYVHGLFDDDVFRHDFLSQTRQRLGLAPAAVTVDVTAERQLRLDRWANHLRQSLNLDLLSAWARGG